MAKASLTLLFATALLVVIGIHGCDAYVRLLFFECPYWDGAKKCHRLGEPRCNDTSCDDGELCCTLSCDGARCLSQKRLCPELDSGVNCTTAQGRKRCTTRCQSGASCCSNDCGGTSCLAEKKSGKCPPLPTGTYFCPEIAVGPGFPEGASTTCASDSNCEGTEKCCDTRCFGDQCTTIVSD